MGRDFITKELEVPIGVLIDVSELFVENEMNIMITGTDIDEETVTLVIRYEKEKRDIFHEATDLIEDHIAENKDEDDD